MELRELAPELGGRAGARGRARQPCRRVRGSFGGRQSRGAPRVVRRVVCEALVAGTPAISTRVGAVPEALSEVDGVTLVEPGSPRALGAALIGDGGPRAGELARGAARRSSLATGPPASLAAFKRVVSSVLES